MQALSRPLVGRTPGPQASSSSEAGAPTPSPPHLPGAQHGQPGRRSCLTPGDVFSGETWETVGLVPRVLAWTCCGVSMCPGRLAQNCRQERSLENPTHANWVFPERVSLDAQVAPESPFHATEHHAGQLPQTSRWQRPSKAHGTRGGVAAAQGGSHISGATGIVRLRQSRIFQLQITALRGDQTQNTAAEGFWKRQSSRADGRPQCWAGPRGGGGGLGVLMRGCWLWRWGRASVLRAPGQAGKAGACGGV